MLALVRDKDKLLRWDLSFLNDEICHFDVILSSENPGVKTEEK